MAQVIQIDLTVFRFLIAGFFFLISFAGIFVMIGKLLSKQKTHCKSIKIITNAMWKEGRPLLQSVKESEKLHKQIMDKLEKMDKKRDGVVKERNEQMRIIELHMQKIDLWYIETHGGE